MVGNELEGGEAAVPGASRACRAVAGEGGGRPRRKMYARSFLQPLFPEGPDSVMMCHKHLPSLSYR